MTSSQSEDASKGPFQQLLSNTEIVNCVSVILSNNFLQTTDLSVHSSTLPMFLLLGYSYTATLRGSPVAIEVEALLILGNPKDFRCPTSLSLKLSCHPFLQPRMHQSCQQFRENTFNRMVLSSAPNIAKKSTM